MRWRTPLVALLALFVAVSCDQQPVEPAADQVAEAPAFNFLNGPETAGPHVVRQEFGGVTWWDFPPEATPDGEWWTVLEGVDHTDNMFFCGGDGTDTPQAEQYVYRPDERTNFVAMRKKSPAYAFHSSDFYTAGGDVIFCGIMELAIAEGTGSIVFNDNDYFGETKINVWGGKLNAWLTDGDTGERYHATWHYKTRWDTALGWPDGVETLVDTGFIK